MTTKTKNPETNLYEEVFQNVRKAAETSLKLQQDIFQHWTKLWPGVDAPKTIWVDKMQEFQKQWTQTIADLARRHRDTFNRQYEAALTSLEEALRVSESSSPEEFRQRTEQLFRKTLDCMRDVSEAQMAEFQEGMNKWGELITKK